MAIELQTLGTLSIQRDGCEITALLRQPSAAALLVFLSVERTATRDKVIGVFWPDQEGRRARHALSQMLYAIRRELNSPWVDSEGERLRVRDTLVVDAVEFADAVTAGSPERAGELYGGVFLDGWHLGSTPEFEHWVESQRSRCARLHREIRRVLLERLVENGDQGGAVLEARRWVDGEPLEPDAQRRLCELLLATGQAAETLHQLSEYRTRLDREELPVPVFVGELETSARRALRVQSSSPPGSSDDSSSVTAWPVESKSPSPDQRARRHRARLALAGALAGISAVALALMLSLRPSVALSPERVAVIPFANLTDDPSLDAVGRLAADWIVDGLARTGAVELASASEVLWALADDLAAEGGTADIAVAGEVGRITGSGTVVYGSIYGGEEEIVFEAEVVQTSTGTVLSPISGVRGPIADPMPLIEDLRERVMGALAIHLNPTLGERIRIERSQPPHYAAYLAYIQGITHFSRREFREATLKLEEAAGLDPTFPQPLVMSGFSAALSGSHARADSLAKRADAERDRLAPYDRHRLDALLARQAGDGLGFYRSMRAATDLAPGGTAHLAAAGAAVSLNRPREALYLFETLDPDGPLMAAYPPYWGSLTQAYHLLGMHERELQEARRGRQQHPMSILPRMYELRAVAALGDGTEAEQLVSELAEMLPQPDPTPGRVMQITAMELRAHGDPETARTILERSLSWFESRPPADADRHRRSVATSLYLLEDWDTAEQLFTMLAAESPDRSDLLGPLGVIAARRGDTERSLEISRELAAIDAQYSFGRPTLWRARIAAWLGNPKEAVDLLRLALEEGSWVLPTLHSDPDMEPLLNFEPFRELLEPRG